MSTDSDRWQRIREVFGDVLEQPTAARAAFVAARCAGDALLEREILELLAAHEGADPLDPAALAGLVPPKDEALPEGRIGAYRVVRQIGRGGMGAVYEALRADEAFEQRVAIKLIKRWSCTGTSSRGTFWSRRKAGSNSWTSASPSCCGSRRRGSRRR